MQADGTAVTDGGSGTPRAITQRAVVAALELNLVSAAEAEALSVQAHSLNESNTVALVACGERAWVAKHAGGATRPGHDWRAELAVYRAASTMPHATIAPTFVGHSHDQELILIEALDHDWRPLDSVDLRTPWSIELLARAATGLARWHQTSRTLGGIGPTQPWLLARANRASGTDCSRLDALVDEILGDRSLHASIQEVQSGWLRSRVIHGDVRLSHIMCHADGPTRLIDWTASGWGDPRWDLAGLLQELHSAEVEHGVDTATHRLAVLSSYAERAQSPSVLSEADPTLQAFVAARLIWLAIQIHESLQGADERVAMHLQAARDVRTS